MPLPAGNTFADKKAPVKSATRKPPARRLEVSQSDGPPMLKAQEAGGPATYRVRYESSEACQAQKPGGHDTIKSYVIVVDGDGPSPVGERVLILHMQSVYGRKDFDAQCAAFAGYDPSNPEDVEAFNAFDPDGHFFYACEGIANDFTDKAEAMVGRLVDVRVSRGKDDGKGGYYRRYSWSVVSDEEQDEAAKVEAS